jgi:hypothetical protein
VTAIETTSPIASPMPASLRLLEDQSQHIAACRAQRHSNPHFAGTWRH